MIIRISQHVHRKAGIAVPLRTQDAGQRTAQPYSHLVCSSQPIDHITTAKLLQDTEHQLNLASPVSKPVSSRGIAKRRVDRW